MRQRTIRSQPQIKDSRRLGWYAAIWDQPAKVYDFRQGAKERSEYTEVVRRGAFLDALGTADHDIVANIDHDDERTFARRSTGELLLQEDGYGLYASCWLPKDDLGDHIRDEVQAGKLDASSFKFTSQREQWDGDTCELLAVNLFDVCLTDRPAYESTRGEVHLRTKSRLRELIARMSLVKVKNKNPR